MTDDTDCFGSMKLSSLQKNNMCVFMLMQRVGGRIGLEYEGSGFNSLM